jgi:hypothetical protein
LVSIFFICQPQKERLAKIEKGRVNEINEQDGKIGKEFDDVECNMK